MKNSTKLFLTLFLLISMLISAFSLPLSVGAAEKIDTTSVYSDLKAMTQIDLSLYQKDVSDDKGAKIIRFLEYAYNANGNQSDYGLYLYVYNPTCEPISTESVYNTIQLSSLTGLGEIAYTKKYKLKCLSVSTEADGEGLGNLYYKFKIEVANGFVDDANLNPKRRCYQITDLELQYSDEITPRLSRIQCTFICTGFQEYHNSDRTNVNTLNTYAENLETIEVEIHPATWKTDTSDKGENYQYEVSSVYFNIPNFYLEKYGDMSDPEFRGLEGVHAEWYEYKINGLVSDNVKLYEAAKDVLGKNYNFDSFYLYENSPGQLDTVRGIYRFYDKDIPLSFVANGKGYNAFDRIYRLDPNVLRVPPDINDPSVGSKCYGPLHNSFNYTGSYFKNLSSKELETAIYGDNGFLVYGYVDEGRTFGYNESYISVSDKSLNSQISSYYDSHGALKAFFKGLGSDKDGYAEIAPIKLLDSSEDFKINVSDEAQAEALFISESDLSDLKSFYNSQTLKNQSVYLMRFAVRDYYFENVDVKDPTSSYSGDHYFFEKTIFHNFDILDFTFVNEYNEKTVVPVSSKPVVIVGEIIPTINNGASIFDKVNEFSNKFNDLALWIKLPVILLGVFLIVFVISKTLPVVLKAISKIFSKIIEFIKKTLKVIINIKK